MSNLSEQKAELRAAILERIQHMNEQSRSAESRSIVRRILEVLPVDRTICAFAPMKTEPDIQPALEEILRRGQALYFPAFDGRHLVMRKAMHLTDLVASSFGIPEPPDTCPPLDPGESVIVLVPGRAFDQKGGRLGRGNGGYDRWLSEHRMNNAASQYYGVAFDCQLVSEVPMEEHDVFLDGIISARGFAPAVRA
ncbi:MAG: 5-formyltetrahydrofolate cyclo-ligase [Candidatus Peregrinibacteria bacterium]